MESRRIILAIKPRLLRDMLRRALENTHGVHIIGEYTERDSLVAAVVRSEAQWVIVSLSADGDMPAVADVLRTATPRVGVLGVARDGSRTRLRTQGKDEDLNGMSLADLIAVLRANSHSDDTPAD